MEERMARLERTCRRQQRVLVALVGALAVLALTGAVGGVSDEVRTRRVAVVDADGREQTVITAGDVRVYSASRGSAVCMAGVDRGALLMVMGRSAGFSLGAFDSGAVWAETVRGDDRQAWPVPR